MSAEVQHELVIPATIQYESNSAFLSDNATSVYKKILTPHFISSIRDERNLWTADFSYHIERSSDTNISEDRNDPAVELGWVHEFETGNLSLNLRHEEGSTRETELNDTGFISVDGTRKSKSASISWLKNLSEVFSFGLNGSGTETTYQNIDLIDYTTRALTARMNYRTTETLLIFLEAGKTRYESIDNQERSDSKQMNIGSQLDISDNTVAILSIGVSETENLDGEGRENQGSFTLNFEEDRIEYSFTLSRTISPSGPGGFSKADQFIGNAVYAVDEISNIGFELNYRKNFDIDENKTRIVSINYNHELGEQWNFTITGSRSEAESNISDVISNDILSISMSYTI
ncbi:MAG: hypothetical protein P8Y24_14105 [Gammaproteobacteria bacterium]